MDFLWIASYPRSGNTLLRTILYQCFNLKSGSLYNNDLGGNKILEDYVGHIEHENYKVPFPLGTLEIIKTHDLVKDERPAIYIIRDVKDVVTSNWYFYEKHFSINDIIEGKVPFGKWSNHVHSWDPLKRENTLLLKYEDMINNLEPVLINLSKFLKKEISSYKLPPREEISKNDGRWVRRKSSWEETLSKENLSRINHLYNLLMRQYGYI